MYTLLALVAATLYILIASREGLANIKYSDQFDTAEKERAWNLLSEADKQTITEYDRTSQQTTDADSPKRWVVSRIQGFWPYSSPDFPVTDGDVDTYINGPEVQNVQYPAAVVEVLRRLLKAYYVGNTRAPAAAGTSGPQAEPSAGDAPNIVDPSSSTVNPYYSTEVMRIKGMQPASLTALSDWSDGLLASQKVADFHRTVYATLPRGTNVTQAQIDNYVKNVAGGEYPYPADKQVIGVGLRKVLTQYFIGSATANALPTPTGMATGGTGSTVNGAPASPGLTTGAAPAVPTMAELETQYKTKYDLYTQYASEALATGNATTREEFIQKIKVLNTELASILAEMIRSLTNSKNTAPSTEKLRDELVSRLQRIQFDYNGLLVSTDKLTTLRRIRQFETAKSTEKVNTYLIGLAVLSALLVLAVILKT